MILGSIVGAFVLCIAMYVVGRHEAENNLSINLMISFGLAFVTAILAMFLGILALPLAFGIGMWAINKFCYLGWGKAAIVTASFFIAQILISLIMGALRAG